MRVVFVCTANICRSPLAEALFTRLLRSRGVESVVVSSAGLHAQTDAPASPGAMTIARERGLDLGAHRARRLDPASIGAGDLVLVMEDMQRRQILSSVAIDPRSVRLLGRFAPKAAAATRGGGDEIDDPTGGPDVAYAACVDRLEACLAKLADWLEDEKISRA